MLPAQYRIRPQSLRYAVISFSQASDTVRSGQSSEAQSRPQALPQLRPCLVVSARRRAPEHTPLSRQMGRRKMYMDVHHHRYAAEDRSITTYNTPDTASQTRGLGHPGTAPHTMMFRRSIASRCGTRSLSIMRRGTESPKQTGGVHPSETFG